VASLLVNLPWKFICWGMAYAGIENRIRSEVKVNKSFLLIYISLISRCPELYREITQKSRDSSVSRLTYIY
jgi:hypothetical protein